MKGIQGNMLKRISGEIHREIKDRSKLLNKSLLEIRYTERVLEFIGFLKSKLEHIHKKSKNWRGFVR